MQSIAVEAFWQAYCATCADHEARRHASYDAWQFGDNERMADTLGQLMLSGTKTATAGLIWEDEQCGWRTPTIGDKTIILDSAGHPLCVIETTAADIVPFNAVDAAFARLEGEGFATVDDWRQAHWRYFAQRWQEIGREPDEEMPILCQQFCVVYPR